MQTHNARFVAGAADPAQLPQLHYPEIAFAGRSNVGKSSLLNRLVGRHALARVSKTPGRTQQINFFLIDERLMFVDLPGYGFARVPLSVKERWKQLVETYLAHRKHLRGVVVLVDLRRGIETDDAALLEYLHAHRIPSIVVATKADKLGHSERTRRADELSRHLPRHISAPLVCSAHTGDGVADLWREIEQRGASPPIRT
ncbi:MAG TPA: ribosome biogenesis GTP-binding protein YihA/YsxC [Candidatus Acidoferrales bacterium]|nr:ribosome biogenesis GTP-binding protein YihA/YsxC [Candidatus Acidoferrales bacterium]